MRDRQPTDDSIRNLVIVERLKDFSRRILQHACLFLWCESKDRQGPGLSPSRFELGANIQPDFH